MRKYILVFICLCQLVIQSQNESANWLFGKYTGLSFLTPSPQVLSLGAMNTSLNSIGPACISDATGNLLFYCRHDTIWNAQHQVMANGTGLTGNAAGSEGKLILKKPLSNNEYYFFYISNIPTTGLFYSVIDMSLAAGMGSVTIKNVPLFTGSILRSFSGAKHCNGQDYWLVMHELNNATFRSYHLSPVGANTLAVLSGVGPTFTNLAASLKINPQNTKIGLANNIPPNGGSVNFFDFDRSTGQVSNHFQVGSNYDDTGSRGCEFSADGSKFYFTGPSNVIHQMNLCAGSPSAIAASDYTVSAPLFTSAFRLASNGKIYALTLPPSMYMSVIHNPNNPGAAMGFTSQGVNMAPHPMGLVLPNFIKAQIKEQLQFTQGLGCLSAQFYPPAISNPTIAACWSSGNAISALSWNFGDPASGPLNTSTLSAPFHTFSAMGSYTVKLAISYANCAPDTIQQLISLVQATANVLTSSVACNGLASATVIVQGGSGNYNYNWLPGLQTGSVATGLANSNHTIQVSDNSFNCNQSFTTAVVVPTLNISAVSQSTAYCNFSNALVNVINGSGNYTYQWQPGNQTTAAVNNLSAGIYSVNITDANYNCSFTHSLQITPLALPNISVSASLSMCAGESRTLQVSGADAYLWNTGSISNNIVVSPVSTSYYSVSGTLTSSGCSAAKTITVAVFPCVNIQEQNSQEGVVDIYPNPNSGWCSVNATKQQHLLVLNTWGETLFDFNIEAGETKLDLRQLPPGLYLFWFDSKNGTKRSVKLIRTEY